LPILARYVIVFAYEFVVFQHVKLLAGRQLFPAYHARKTVEVKNFVPGFPHQISRRYSLGTTIALFAVPPAVDTKKKSINYTRTPFKYVHVCLSKYRYIPYKVYRTSNCTFSTAKKYIPK
jgi:hypothetical protein